MNQQQLQTARTALWRQNGQPLLTGDDAASWLDEMGICLFLPRHAQLPAPASSFVEACSGEGRAVPALAAIDAAMALATRLVAEGRAVPLNLMGNLTEQPDFLVTPETLRWVAAVRGDRNWKAAPAGRTAPIVLRVWEALDRERGRTEPQIREELGRELTEAAVLRALVELWTTFRAAPEYAAGEPTRWSLMRDRYPQEMAAGASTAQTTALSALISLYLGQAIAATSEEAEIFLSPLTARSRIREVLHGMLATRQFGTMPLGAQTLLYLEGTLPEVAETPAQEAASAVMPAAAAEAREKREELRRASGRKPESRHEPGREQRPERGEFGRGKKPPYGAGRTPGERPQPRFGRKPGLGSGPGRDFGKPGGRPGGKRGGKPREKPGEFRGPRREGWAEQGPGRSETGQKFRSEGAGWKSPRRPDQERRPAPPREAGEGGHFQKKPWRPRRPQRESGAATPARGEFRRENRGEFRPDNREPGKNRGGFRRDDRLARGGKPGKPKFGTADKPSGTGERRDHAPQRPFRQGESRPDRPNRPQRPGTRPPGRPGGGPGTRLGSRPNRPTRPGQPGTSDRTGRPDRGAAKFGKPAGGKFGRPGGRFGKPGGKFRKPGQPRADRPWKNRPDKNGAEGPHSGKNRKEPKDQPE